MMQRWRCGCQVLIGVLVIALMPLSLAEAPVVDINQGQTSPAASDTATPPQDNSAGAPNTAPAAPPLTDAERLSRLEQQMANLTNMNLPQQISDLQQQVAQLRGQLDVQSHDLKLLDSQQRSFYQDLDQRINQLKNLNGAPTSVQNPPPSVNSAAGSDIRLKDSGAYQAALQQLENKEYDKAQGAFQAYLNDYPNGQYVMNAHYWLGEIYFAQKQNAKSAVEFQLIIDKYPNSIKVPDAQLKLAFIHAAQGQVAQAKRELLQIKAAHPNSTAAQLATMRLQQMANTASPPVSP